MMCLANRWSRFVVLARKRLVNRAVACRGSDNMRKTTWLITRCPALSPIDELPRNPSGKVLKTELREFDLQSVGQLAARPRPLPAKPWRRSCGSPQSSAPHACAISLTVTRRRVAVELPTCSYSIWFRKYLAARKCRNPTHGFWTPVWIP